MYKRDCGGIHKWANEVFSQFSLSLVPSSNGLWCDIFITLLESLQQFIPVMFTLKIDDIMLFWQYCAADKQNSRSLTSKCSLSINSIFLIEPVCRALIFRSYEKERWRASLMGVSGRVGVHVFFQISSTVLNKKKFAQYFLCSPSNKQDILVKIDSKTHHFWNIVTLSDNYSK